MVWRTVGCVGIAFLSASMAAAQTPAASPRASDGHPDLQGYWYFGTATPLERPVAIAGKEFLVLEIDVDGQRKFLAIEKSAHRHLDTGDSLLQLKQFDFVRE